MFVQLGRDLPGEGGPGWHGGDLGCYWVQDPVFGGSGGRSGVCGLAPARARGARRGRGLFGLDVERHLRGLHAGHPPAIYPLGSRYPTTDPPPQHRPPPIQNRQ